MSRLKCGCTPDASGFGYCDECVRKLKEKIWAKMSPERKAYDREFSPQESSKLDNAIGEYDGESSGCSCHINPPCSYCVDLNDDEDL